MLKKVVIKHFRSCVDLTIDDIGPMMVLVGRNGMGKTNILRAILWAAETAMQPEPVERGDLRSDAVSLEFDLEGTRFKYSIESGSNLTDDDRSGLNSDWLKESVEIEEAPNSWKNLVSRNKSEVQLSEYPSLQIAPSSPSLPFLFAYLPPENLLITTLRPVRDFLSRVSYYPFDEPNETAEGVGVIRDEEYQGWRARSKAKGRDDDSVLMKLVQMHNDSPEDFNEVKSLLGDDGLNIVKDIIISSKEIDLSVGGRLNRFHFVSFHSYQQNRLTNTFSFAKLSLGTRRIIRIIVSMIFDKSSVMMIEHPEDGIHRGLVDEVFGVLRGYADPCQMIISSHSTSVFDLMGPEEVRLVDMEDGKTRARALSSKEIEGARKYMNEKGSFSDYLKLQLDV